MPVHNLRRKIAFEQVEPNATPLRLGYSVSLGNFSSNSKRERTVSPLISIIVPVWGDDGLVGELVNGEPSSIDLSPFAVERFG